MIDLVNGLPNAIEVDGNLFLIKTDFRDWLDFEKITKNSDLQDNTVSNLEKYFFEEISITKEVVEQLSFFYSSPEVTPKYEKENSENVLDFEMDGSYIYASFMHEYGIDLIDIEYLHWHKFLALLYGLPDDSKIMQIMSMRSYKKSNKSAEQYQEESKRAWSLPKVQTEEEKEIISELQELFYNS